MNALILTEGGHGIGMGHLVRCTAVAQAMREAGVAVRMIVNADESIAEQIRQADAETGDWLSDDALRQNAMDDCEIALVDSYLAGAEIYQQVSDAVTTAAFFDDCLRIKYPPGLVINGAIAAAEMPYKPASGTTYLLGGACTALRREFWDVPDRSAVGEIENILITVGATDRYNLTPEFLGVMTSHYPQWRKHVVVGAAFDNVADIEACRDEQTELIRHPDAAGMRRIMTASDLAISACGQTLGELARTATPTIGVLVVDNQKLNADGWRQCGFLEYVGDCSADDLRDRILSAVKTLTSPAVRAQRGQAGRANADGQGARRIVERILASA